MSEPDHGQSDAINKGLRIASGEIVNWLNSDDYYEPNSLFHVASAFDNTTTLCVCARSNIVTEDGSSIKSSNGTDVYQNNLAKTIGWARIDQPETFFRKSAIDEMGLVNTELHYVMDKEWWIRFLLKLGLESIKVIDTPIVNFRLHADSKTVKLDNLFLPETNGLFFTIADFLKLDNLKKVMLDNCEINKNATILLNLKEIDQTLLKASLNYHILYLADFYYYTSRIKATQELISIIDPELIGSDVLLLRKLKYRSLLIPQWLKKLVKKT